MAQSQSLFWISRLQLSWSAGNVVSIMLMRSTDMSPVVRVAVFPVMISLSWPAVSRAPRFLMRRCSYLRVSTEKAIAIEMTRGMPSGMQTIRRAIAVEARSMARVIEGPSTSLYSLNITKRSQTIPKRTKATVVMR
jgi:hypothetical protein